VGHLFGPALLRRAFFLTCKPCSSLQTGRPKLLRPGLYENILPGEESEANNASRARSKSQQKVYEISGLGHPHLPSYLQVMAQADLFSTPPGPRPTPAPEPSAGEPANPALATRRPDAPALPRRIRRATTHPRARPTPAPRHRSRPHPVADLLTGRPAPGKPRSPKSSRGRPRASSSVSAAWNPTSPTCAAFSPPRRTASKTPVSPRSCSLTRSIASTNRSRTFCCPTSRAASSAHRRDHAQPVLLRQFTAGLAFANLRAAPAD
jgi:hypothetical protein